ncbi:AcrVA2 family anti-CRISPR protein [Polaromonas sp. JS666]|uniref:AcrVA2 family anti-CRISPR protein n=1 Tax=Polaromonas sp. (strain JS666 / ATCC BAA-500) TaxID=296591 RepID=UPI0000537B0A|nr:hypothetical protein [Polaromonas sp. JS666]ABE46947.1 hypothetical protein Bpro_5076 [Polaromonas sp. JS666]
MKSNKKYQFGQSSDFREAVTREVTLPQRVLDGYGHDFPGAWKVVEMARKYPEAVVGYGWKDWCYLPVNVMGGVLAELKKDTYSLAEAEMLLMHQMRLGSALAAWRMTKGVYRFDPTLLEEIVNSDVKDGLPEDCFFRLPDWCVYIPTPGMQHSPGLKMHGFFSYIDDHASSGKRGDEAPELHFEILVDPKMSDPWALVLLLRSSPELILEFTLALRRHPQLDPGDFMRSKEFIHVHDHVDLLRGSFGAASKASYIESLNAMQVLKEVQDNLPEHDSLSNAWKTVPKATDDEYRDPDMVNKVLDDMNALRLRLASLVLYLCADESDVAPQGLGNRRAALRTQESAGKRSYSADRISFWDVGFRVGSALREARTIADRTGPGDGGTVRPHMRRAHWHTYNTGPRDGQQARRVKWLSPIAVNLRSPDELVPTLHYVDAHKV